MSKYPRPGTVKTRLVGDFTPTQAADIHRALLLHWVRRLRNIRGIAQAVLCFDPPDAAAAMRALVQPVAPQMTLLPQSPGDLGQRLATAANSLFPTNDAVLFVGVDSPDVPDDHVEHAVRLARRANVSVSPTDDGGFWALGVRRGVDCAALLSNIDWSSGRECRQTLDRAAALACNPVTGPTWHDVDRPADLRTLLDRLALSNHSEDQGLLMNLHAIVGATTPDAREVVTP
jgi:rSAM/selenodomain-associated transferase 1